MESPGGSLGLHGVAANDIYASGGGILHWDGQTWAQTADFAPAAAGLASIDAGSSCRLFAAGVELSGPERAPFTARIVPSLAVQLSVTGACGGPGSLDLTGVTPGARVAVFEARSSVPGGYSIEQGPCAGTTLDLEERARRVAGGTVGSDGSFHLDVTRWRCRDVLVLQALDQATCEISNVTSVVP